MQADEARRGRRQEQHVARAEQLLGAVAVENRARVDLRRHAERDPRGQVGLDQAGDDVDRRPLRREDQVDADRARHLRQPAIDSSTSLLATIIRSASSSMTTTMKGSGLGGSPSRRRPLCSAIACACCGCTARCCARLRGERLVALLHLAHRPAQRVGRLLRIDDDRRQQVRDVLVHPELEPLRIDHDQPHIVGRRAVEDAREHGVDADRLAGAGRSGDQQVRHRGEVGDERLAVNGLAERERQLRRRAAVGSDSSSSRSEICSRVRSGSGCRRWTCRGCDRSAPTRPASRGTGRRRGR